MSKRSHKINPSDLRNGVSLYRLIIMENHIQCEHIMVLSKPIKSRHIGGKIIRGQFQTDEGYEFDLNGQRVFYKTMGSRIFTDMNGLRDVVNLCVPKDIVTPLFNGDIYEVIHAPYESPFKMDGDGITSGKKLLQMHRDYFKKNPEESIVMSPVSINLYHVDDLLGQWYVPDDSMGYHGSCFTVRTLKEARKIAHDLIAGHGRNHYTVSRAEHAAMLYDPYDDMEDAA